MEDDKKLPKKTGSNSMIYVSNNMLDSIYKLSLPEKRVLWYFLKDYRYNRADTFPVDGILKHSEYAELYGITKQQAAKEIRNACLSLVDNSCFQLRPDWNGNILDELDEKVFTNKELNELSAFEKINFVDKCSYGISRGQSRIIFSRSFLEQAVLVKGYFTQYRLYHADCLTNANHIALFEHCQRWLNEKEGTGCYITTPTALINKLLLPKTYERYTQMRRGFLVPSIENINKNTGIEIDLVEEREIKDNPKSKVVKLYFNVTAKTKSGILD